MKNAGNFKAAVLMLVFVFVSTVSASAGIDTGGTGNEASLKPAESATPGAVKVTEQKYNIASVNLLSLYFGDVSVFYERAMGNSLSLAISFRYTYTELKQTIGTNSDMAYGMGIDLNYYPLGTSPAGFYFGPGVLAMNGTSIAYTYDHVKHVSFPTYIMADAHAGFCFIIGPGLVIDILAGAIVPVKYILRAQVNIGYAF